MMSLALHGQMAIISAISWCWVSTPMAGPSPIGAWRFPNPRPQLVLTAPSGEIWTYGEDAGDERIEGAAEQFCQVVTQTRNIADTELVVTGPNAKHWMNIAQCFAGPPNDPPKPGLRKMRV